MYSRIKISSCCQCAGGILCRYLSSAEVSTALRPFYFSVHPDLFGKYPEQRKINENSLQQLSALLEAQQSSRSMSVPALPFYLRQKDMADGEFKLVKIQLNSKNVRETVVNVLNACDISTKYIDKIPKRNKEEMRKSNSFSKENFTNAYREYSTEFEKVARMKRKMEEKKAVENIIEWIYDNSALAKSKYDSTSATRDQVKSLIDHLCNTYGIKEVGLELSISFPTLQLTFAYYIPVLNLFYRPWRLLNQIISLLSVLNFVLLKCFVLESPKFYFSRGETEKGREVLKKIFAVNSGKSEAEYSVKNIVLNEDENKAKSTNFFQSVWNQTVPLFHKKHLLNTVLIFGISVPTYCVGPPFSVWMPYIFNTYQNLGVPGMSFCQMFHIETHPSSNETVELEPVCDDNIVPFTFAAIASFACTITVVSMFSVVLIKYIGKKWTYVGFHVLAAVLAVAIDNVDIDWGIVAFIGMMCNVVCMGITTSYAVELFPTYMRAMAVGLSMMFARAVSFIFFNIIGVQLLTNCSNFFLYMAIFLLAGAVLGLFLPSERKPTPTNKEAGCD